ncbi:MAG: DUF4430 domain-containing protein [Planctomycetales bacterium]|nr:DUF4430 domain-containing protein [Planctomycetales bacterium]
MSQPTELSEKRRSYRGAALLAIAGAVLLVVFARVSCQSDSSSPANPVLGPGGAGAVTLRVEFGDLREPWSIEVPCRDGDTVEQIMRRAARSDPSFAFEVDGSGEAAFVTEIAGQANEGAGEGTRNWIFYVGSERAKTSYARQPVSPDKPILWRFERYDEQMPVRSQ